MLRSTTAHSKFRNVSEEEGFKFVKRKNFFCSPKQRKLKEQIFVIAFDLFPGVESYGRKFSFGKFHVGVFVRLKVQEKVQLGGIENK